MRGMIYAVLLAVLLGTPCVAVGTPAPSGHAPERVTVQLPGGVEMHFRAVYLGIDGRRWFASRRIKLGSRQGEPSYKQGLVETLLAGGFVGERNGRPDWLYYVGETEVTRGQWAAVIGSRGNAASGATPSEDAALPQTAVSPAEVAEFIEMFNGWLLQKERDGLPRLGNAIAFARLPTESEWAFAARGGIEVLETDPDRFDRQHPYPVEVGDHEWHRRNSGNQLQPAGSRHIAPNPIGLYDMLGNAEELTRSLFGPEYQHGRFGHLSIRGGNYSTDPARLSASMRTEYVSHDPTGEVRRPQKVGFRLALGTRISAAGLAPDEIDAAYASYLPERELAYPGPAGGQSPASQAGTDLNHALTDRIARLEADKQRLADELAAARDRRQTAQGEAAVLAHRNAKLAAERARLKDEISALNRRSVDFPKPSRLEELAVEKDELQTEVAELRRLHETALDRLAEMRQRERELVEEIELARVKLADQTRRQQGFVHELTKSAGRVRTVEKRYLEALMRQASANAYIGWRILRKREILMGSETSAASARRHEQAYEEAAQMINDYWRLVQQIAEETQPGLFAEVKVDLAHWLRVREREGAPGNQRKALDLIERHVKEVRAGQYRRPKDLVDTFTMQPELGG